MITGTWYVALETYSHNNNNNKSTWSQVRGTSQCINIFIYT